MSWIVAFFRQPCRPYRDFQIVFTILTLNFAIPSASYVLAPRIAADQFLSIGRTLGGGDYPVPEAESRLWRYLGATNVMALAFMCFFLQLDLRRNYPVLVPLTFLKGATATLFLLEFLLGTRYPAFLAVSVFDFFTCALFVFFARRAHAEIRDRPDADLVPRPRR
ncbi:MAG: hypothetical protein HY720_29330 [Planctomycetes bacterium]|nr:hypothetical protein [Planctomycetota bacterium]